jgi:hypothetical protein
VADAFSDKRDAALHLTEMQALMSLDLLFPYLKASIEKALALVGFAHGFDDLDAKKKHGSRMAALKNRLPKVVQQTAYWGFLLNYTTTDNLAALNRYRTGLLHKKGIAELQPHSYISTPSRATPLLRVYELVHEQHTRNTGMVLAALAILTDELVRLDPPGAEAKGVLAAVFRDAGWSP